jgi:hypothetical protein
MTVMHDRYRSPNRGITIRRLRTLRCRDCGVRQGQLHDYGCLQERCVTCGNQAALCGHYYDLTTRRVPYIAWSNVCASCGQLNPDFFHVPDMVWRHYIQPDQRDAVVCLSCP